LTKIRVPSLSYVGYPNREARAGPTAALDTGARP